VIVLDPGMRFLTLDVENLDVTKRFGAGVKARFPALNVLIDNTSIMRSENLQARVEDLAIAEQT
jgi:short-subunit dehydrogenase involved in D-alanine esterification of teichoic acids